MAALPAVRCQDDVTRGGSGTCCSVGLYRLAERIGPQRIDFGNRQRRDTGRVWRGRWLLLVVDRSALDSVVRVCILEVLDVLVTKRIVKFGFPHEPAA